MSRQSENPGVPWPAVDGLGRELPLTDETNAPKPDRFVGIFYFLWNGAHNHGGGIYDVSKILEKDPEALKKPDSPLWGPHGAMHFWSEPLYGYYKNADPWVLRRHANLLADAGVDFLIFDTTNRVTYRDVYMNLCEVFSAIRAEGGKTPQFTFMTNTRAGETADELYRDLYGAGKYPDLWFRWEGKPLLICDPKEASDQVKDFFTLRKAHWPFEQVNTPYAWHWEAAYPQHYGYTDDPNKPEQVNVSVAQNLRDRDGRVTNMSEGNARGRSFHDGMRDMTPGAVNYGYNAAEQWDRALELDPPIVMVTGWNEWIAGRWGSKDKIAFVDQYDEEYSRDIEPMKGGHGDNYYYQLVAGVRRYKGVPKLPKASAPKTIELAGSMDQWADVKPAFTDHAHETLPRDFAGVEGLHYTNTTGRNDFLEMKVARDGKNVYFHVRTKADITPAGDNWMMLFLDTDGKAETGWEGYNFVVNRKQGTLERNAGGWTWEKAADVALRVEGKEMHLVIPRAALGIAEDAPFTLDFKWADNLQRPGDVMDFYLSGDVAPEGRFKYRYVAE